MIANLAWAMTWMVVLMSIAATVAFIAFASIEDDEDEYLF